MSSPSNPSTSESSSDPRSAPYRYVWPSELDLMGRLTGFRLRDRWAGWDRTPFTSGSQHQVAVFERLAG